MTSKTLALAALALVGCAPTMQSGGFTVTKAETEEAFIQIRPRASFDLECPREQLQFTVLAIDENFAGAQYPTSIGVEGCGKKAVYVKAGDTGWVNDTKH